MNYNHESSSFPRSSNDSQRPLEPCQSANRTQGAFAQCLITDHDGVG